MMRDATSALLRTVNFGNFQAVSVEKIRSRNWTSATFAGTRHEFTLRLEGDGADAAADAFLDDIEDREFNLNGHILADIALVSRSNARSDAGPVVRIELEALTLEEG